LISTAGLHIYRYKLLPWVTTIVSFPGLHAPSICHLQYEKRGEGLVELVTWYMPW